MNVDKLEEVWTEQKRFLRDGLLDGAIWSKQTGLPISTTGEVRHEFIALFSQILDGIGDTLTASGSPGLNRYLFMNLKESGLLIVVIKHDDDTLQAMSLNPKRINLGLLFNIAIPKALAKVKEATA